MTEMLLDGLRHLLTLLFGIGVSAAFLDVAPTRKNIVILSVFSALDFIVLCILFLLQSDSVTYAFYPLLTHMPLVLLFTLAFKCRLHFLFWRFSQRTCAVRSATGSQPYLRHSTALTGAWT